LGLAVRTEEDINTSGSTELSSVIVLPDAAVKSRAYPEKMTVSFSEALCEADELRGEREKPNCDKSISW
jgi:hypothetical protein